MSNGATIVGSQRSVTDANTANGPPACPLPSVSRAFRCAGVARPSMSTSCVPCPRWTAPGHIPGRATPRPSSFTSPYAPLSMIHVYTPRQLPCDGGASKLHGHPQSQLHSPRRNPDIRHFEAINGTVPGRNGPRTIKDAGRFTTPYGSSVVVEPPSPSAGRTDRCLRRRSSRHPDREGCRSQHEDRGDKERQTEEVELTPEADRPRIYQPEEDRPDGSGETGDARVGPLELALFRRTHAPGHEALQRWCGKPDRREHERGEEEDEAVRREAPDDERRGPEEEGGEERSPLAEARDESLHEASLDRDVQRPDERERQAHVERSPTVAVVGVEDEDGREGLERQELDERDGSEAEEVPVRAEQCEDPTGFARRQANDCRFPIASDSGRTNRP